MRSLTTLAVASCCVTASSVAAAQSLAGAHRLSLDGTVYRGEASKLKAEGTESTYSAGSVGILGAGLGAGYHYGVTQNLLIGGRALYVSSTSEATGRSTAHETDTWLLPQVSVLLADSGEVRPFLTGGLGVRLSSAESGGEKIYSWTAVAAGVTGGLHYFAAPGFSIDPSASLFVTKGNGDFGGTSVEISSTVLLGSVSLSGWLGMKAPEVVRPAAYSDPPAAPAPPPSTEFSGRPALSLTPSGGGSVRLVAGVHGTRRVRIIVSHPDKQGAIKSCAMLTVGVAGKKTEAPAERIRALASGQDKALAVYIDAAALTGDGPVTIEACGETWTLEGEQLARIKTYVDGLEAEAQPRR